MKNKELNELKAKSLQDLTNDLKNKKNELFTLRFQLATGQLENTAAINECRKDIARVQTVMREMAKKA